MCFVRVEVIVHLRSTISRRHAMNCFECAKANDSVPAVAVCRHCNVGLCLDHLIEASEYRVAGTTFGCSHEIPHVKPLSGAPAGITSARRHHTAALR
jgi:hypothetical protein